jgi:predicted outer membrane repeat protein
VLDGFTITAGYANGSGDPDNSGGGMYNNYGSPTIINCTFSKNAASYAGGMANRNHCSPTVINCTFIGNSVHSGGAGMFDWHSSSTLINCNFCGNFGRYGAAMQIYDSNTTLTNCTFSGNFAREQGGAIYVSYSSVHLNNCSIAGNVAGLFYGGGIYNRVGSSSLFLTNCILWNNSDSSGMDESAQIYGGTPVISFCCIQGWTDTWIGPGNIGSDPMLVRNPDDGGDGWGVGDMVDFGKLLSIGSNDDFGDLHLLVDSPCIDAGDPNYTIEPNETDLDGNPRVIGGRIDMGAYEFFNTPPVANAGPDQVAECACNTVEVTKVTLDGTGSSDTDGDPLTYTWTGSFTESPAYGATPTVTLEAGCPGEYVITLVVNDGTEDSEPDDVVITVVDTTPPDFVLSVSPTMLWPPDHMMYEITPNWTVSDDCDATPDVMLISIAVSEADDIPGSGNTKDDIQIGQDGSIYLRSERSGTSSERIYTITYQAVDDSGNTAVRTATVSIPHDFKVLARIAAQWLWAGRGRIPEDLNGDGIVNLADFARFAENWIK